MPYEFKVREEYNVRFKKNDKMYSKKWCKSCYVKSIRKWFDIYYEDKRTDDEIIKAYIQEQEVPNILTNTYGVYHFQLTCAAECPHYKEMEID